MKYWIYLAFASLPFLSSCSSIKMERPEPHIYDALKNENLFGIWENSSSKLRIECTGRVDFVEYRNGKEHNKDKGGKVSKIDVEKNEMTISSIFGDNVYHYRHLEKGRLEFLVGKRAGWVEYAKVAASHLTFVEPEQKLTLSQEKKYDCDNAPQTLGEVFQDMGEKLKNGEFEVVKKP